MSYDVYFEARLNHPSGKPFTFGYVSAVGVAGAQKLINRWVKCLLTLKGSDPFDKEEGTEFPNVLGANFADEQEFLDFATLCIQDCNAQMRAYDEANLPPLNERFDSASVAKVVVRPDGGYDLWVKLRNSAGEVVPLNVPTILG